MAVMSCFKLCCLPAGHPVCGSWDLRGVNLGRAALPRHVLLGWCLAMTRLARPRLTREAARLLRLQSSEQTNEPGWHVHPPQRPHPHHSHEGILL